MRTSLCALLALRGATWVIKSIFDRSEAANPIQSNYGDAAESCLICANALQPEHKANINDSFGANNRWPSTYLNCDNLPSIGHKLTRSRPVTMLHTAKCTIKKTSSKRSSFTAYERYHSAMKSLLPDWRKSTSLKNKQKSKSKANSNNLTIEINQQERY